MKRKDLVTEEGLEYVDAVDFGIPAGTVEVKHDESQISVNKSLTEIAINRWYSFPDI